MSAPAPPTHDGRWRPNTGKTTYEVSVTRPISPAIDWVRGVLFPFDFMKWLTFTVPVFLIMCGEGGGGGNFGNSFGGPGGGGPGGGPTAGEIAEQVDTFLANNVGVIIAVGIGVFILLVAFMALLSFLAARGHFIQLDNMLTGVPAVQEPWERLGSLANSLWMLRFVMNLIGSAMGVALLLVVGVQFLSVLRSAGDEQLGFDLVMQMFIATLGFLLILSPIFIALMAFNVLTIDFAVPIMYRYHLRVSDAWGQLWALMRSNAGAFGAYILFRCVIGFILAMMEGVIVMLATCACCIGLIPVIGQIPLLPIYAFRRVYTVLYLEQFGPDWEIFSREAPPPQDYYAGNPVM